MRLKILIPALLVPIVAVGAATSRTATFTLGRLGPFEVGTGSFTWAMVSGLMACRAVVDANADVPELQGNNNENFFSF